MSSTPLYARIQQLQPKLHGLAIGMTLGIGGMFLGQACPMSGTCPTCNACVIRLPLMALPLLADGVVLLSAKLLQHNSEKVG